MIALRHAGEENNERSGRRGLGRSEASTFEEGCGVEIPPASLAAAAALPQLDPPRDLG